MSRGNFVVKILTIETFLNFMFIAFLIIANERETEIFTRMKAKNLNKLMMVYNVILPDACESWEGLVHTWGIQAAALRKGFANADVMKFL